MRKGHPASSRRSAMNEDLNVEINILSLPLELQMKVIKHLMAEAEEKPIETKRLDLLMNDELTYPFTRAELFIAEELALRTFEKLRHFKIINFPREVQAWVDEQLDVGAPWEDIAKGLADRTGETKRVCHAALWQYEKCWKKKRASRVV